jgi:hypothetical protein
VRTGRWDRWIPLLVAEHLAELVERAVAARTDEGDPLPVEATA